MSNTQTVAANAILLQAPLSVACGVAPAAIAYFGPAELAAWLDIAYAVIYIASLLFAGFVWVMFYRASHSMPVEVKRTLATTVLNLYSNHDIFVGITTAVVSGLAGASLYTLVMGLTVGAVCFWMTVFTTIYMGNVLYREVLRYWVKEDPSAEA